MSFAILLPLDKGDKLDGRAQEPSWTTTATWTEGHRIELKPLATLGRMSVTRFFTTHNVHIQQPTNTHA